MSHEHRDYFLSNMKAMCRIEVDRKLNGRETQTKVLNGEGLRIWYIVIDNVQTNLLYMSLDALSNATGISKENVRKRMAVFVEAGWLIERGFEKHGIYAATKTYEVVLDVLGVGHLTPLQGESQGTSHSGSHGRSRSRSHGESRNTVNPTQERETVSNPIPNTNPTPTVSESANNNDNTNNAPSGGMETRIENIVSLCIDLELKHTKNVGKPLLNTFQRDYSCLVAAELQERAWLTNEQTADICYAKRHSKQPPTYARPTCRTCGGRNIDENGRSQICQTDSPPYIYGVCHTCGGDGFQPLKELTRSMFTNLNTKGITS